MILEPGKLTIVRARFSIAIVILLAAAACLGGPTGDYPNNVEPPRLDAGAHVSDPGAPGGAGSSADAGAAAGELDAESQSPGSLDAGSPTSIPPCVPPADAGDAAADAGDSGADGALASDAQVDADANFPDAAGDAQPPLTDGASDAPHMPFTPDACVP